MRLPFVSRREYEALYDEKAEYVKKLYAQIEELKKQIPKKIIPSNDYVVLVDSLEHRVRGTSITFDYGLAVRDDNTGEIIGTFHNYQAWWRVI